MIAVGALIGGAFLWLFVAIAVALNVVGYFYSDRIALRVARARPLRRGDAPEIHGAVAELASRAQIEMPRLYVMPGQPPNAFATGRNERHAAVAMTEGLLTDFSLDQVRGVLAHEHIVNPLAGRQLTTLFSTHPPLRERIRRLRAYRAPRAQVYRTEVASPTG
jgi:heat shock protein HtpX